MLSKEEERIIKQESKRFHKSNKWSDSGIEEDKASEDIKVKDLVYITNKYTEAQDREKRNTKQAKRTVYKGQLYNPNKFTTVTSIEKISYVETVKTKCI